MNIILKSLTWLLVFCLLVCCVLLNVGFLIYLGRRNCYFYVLSKFIFSFLCIFLSLLNCVYELKLTLQSQSYLMTLIWQRNHKKINCTEFFVVRFFRRQFSYEHFFSLPFFFLVGRCCHSSVQRWRFWCLSWSGIIACRAIGRNWRT